MQICPRQSLWTVCFRISTHCHRPSVKLRRRRRRPGRAAARLVPPELALDEHLNPQRTGSITRFVKLYLGHGFFEILVAHKLPSTGRQAKSGSQRFHREFQFVLAFWRNPPKGTFSASEGEPKISGLTGIRVISPDFPLELTRFSPGKHLIHFLVFKMEDFRNFIQNNCILVFDAEQVYFKLQTTNLKNKEITVNPKHQTLEKSWFFENPIP